MTIGLPGAPSGGPCQVTTTVAAARIDRAEFEGRCTGLVYHRQ
jgi:hypothetical protein